MAAAYPAGAGTTPPAAPTMGSKMKAATVSGPSERILCSSSPARNPTSWPACSRRPADRHWRRIRRPRPAGSPRRHGDGRRNRRPTGRPSVLPCQDRSRAMKRRFFISPRAAKYCRATFKADSTASEPSPEYNDVLEAAARNPFHQIGQRFERGAGEQVSVGVSHRLELLDDGGIDLGMRMAETEDRGTTGAVQIGLAGFVEEIRAACRGLSAEDLSRPKPLPPPLAMNPPQVARPRSVPKSPRRRMGRKHKSLSYKSFRSAIDKSFSERRINAPPARQYRDSRREIAPCRESRTSRRFSPGSLSWAYRPALPGCGY